MRPNHNTPLKYTQHQHLESPLKSSAMKKRFKGLMEQQFWLWGCDVRRAEGNLLILGAFTKTRPPEDSSVQISRYTKSISPTQTIMLWGFGAAIDDSERGVLFIPRYGLRPRCGMCGTDLAGFWDPTRFLQLPTPQEVCEHETAWLLLADLLRWVSDYEGWVLSQAGLAYRSSSITAWKRPVEPAASLPDLWKELAHEISPLRPRWASRTSQPSLIQLTPRFPAVMSDGSA